ncbi:hypothetical protein JHK82_023885 [Glycine max]|nr:hypothetical protein JHK82_023885 [Glycine max]
MMQEVKASKTGKRVTAMLFTGSDWPGAVVSEYWTLAESKRDVGTLDPKHRKNVSFGKAHEQHWDTTASHMAYTKAEDPSVLHEYGHHL